MGAITVPNCKLFAPLLMGIAILAMQSSSDLTTLPMGLMIALAGVMHMTAMSMRDAEFGAQTKAHGLNAKDVLAYACMVLYDAILLFGLVSGAGLLLLWNSFLSITCLVIVAMPVALFIILRKHYDPVTALQSGGLRHWAPPFLLGVMAFSFWGFETLQMPSGSQPYLWLVLLSVNLAATNPETSFVGNAKIVRYALFAGLAVLLIWNYLNI